MSLSEDDFMRLQEELIRLKTDSYEAKSQAKRALQGWISSGFLVGLAGH
jgi:hypothetical protein